MSTAIQTTVNFLETLPAIKIAEDQRVAEKFISVFNKVHGSKHGEMIYETEKYHFMKKLSANQELQKCSKASLYGAFIDMAVQGLSLDPTKNLAYLVPSNVNVGTRENPIWEKRATLEISPYGELGLRQKNGQLEGAEEPVVVYDGDTFECGERDGKKFVNYSLKVDHKEIVIGCFLKLLKKEGGYDYVWLLKSDITRLMKYSDKKNKGNGDLAKANPLYTSGPGNQIDSGFLKAKTIKHAFKAYPKINIKGSYSRLEESEDNDNIDYSIGEPAPASHQIAQNGNDHSNGNSQSYSTAEAVEPEEPTSSIVDDNNY